MSHRHHLDYAGPQDRIPPIGVVSIVIGAVTCIADVWWTLHGFSGATIDIAILLPISAAVGMVTGRTAKSMSHHELAGFGWIVSLMALFGSIPTVGIAVLFWILPSC